MKKVSTKFICLSAAIAAAYVLLTFISPGEFRLSEVLCILPAFSAAAVPGVSIGCFLANLFMGTPIYDVVFGTLATVIGAFGTYWLRKHRWLMPLPPIISNTVIIPLVLKFAYQLPDSFPALVVMIGTSEIICVYVLGQFLYQLLHKNANKLF